MYSCSRFVLNLTFFSGTEPIRQDCTVSCAASILTHIDVSLFLTVEMSFRHGASIFSQGRVNKKRQVTFSTSGIFKNACQPQHVATRQKTTYPRFFSTGACSSCIEGWYLDFWPTLPPLDYSLYSTRQKVSKVACCPDLAPSICTFSWRIGKSTCQKKKKNVLERHLEAVVVAEVSQVTV